MTSRTLLTTIATTAVAALAPAAATAGQTAPVKVTGAYFYVDHMGRAGDYAHVVFRTAQPIARGRQNSLQAGVQIEGVGLSIGTVDKARNIYEAYTPIKGGSIAARRADGTPIRKGAKLGRVFRIVVETRAGQKIARTVTLRAERAGDAAGRPLR